MKKHFVKFGVVAAAGLAFAMVSGQAAAVGEVDANGWKVQGSGAGIVEGTMYSLDNLDQGGCLGYKDRAGANLNWDKCPNHAMKVKRKTAGSGPIKCGEVFALFIEQEWIIHEKQRWSIDLSSRSKLDKDSYYQWKFANCKEGEVVPLNAPVALQNVEEKDIVVGCKRALGVNLCWKGDAVHFNGKNYRKADVPH